VGAWGWWILNYKRYRDCAAREDRAAQSTERSRRWRERKKANEINDGTQGDAVGRMGRYTDTNTDTNKNDCASFDAFWSLYPKKVDKKRAQVSWQKLSLEKQKMATADIETRYQSVKKQFIPNPTTYIHGERWNDEPNESVEEESIFKHAEKSIV